MAYRDVVLADAPLVYWKLDETSGTVATDLGSLAVNGNHTGTPTKGVTGITAGDTAVNLNGTSQYVRASTSTGSRYAPYAFEAWVKWDRVTGNEQIVFWCNNGIKLSLVDASTMNIWIGNASNWSILQDTISTTTATGVWYHYVVTVASTGVKVYRNGTQIYTSGVNANAALEYNLAFAGSVPVVGVQNVSGTNSLFTGATIDEFAIYGAVLSVGRVTDHYNAGLATFASLFTDTFDGAASAAFDSTKWSTANSSSGNATITQNGSGKGKIVTLNGNGYYAIGRSNSSTYVNKTNSELLATITKDSAARPYTLYAGVNVPSTLTSNGSSAFVPTNGAWIEVDGNAPTDSVVIRWKNTSGSVQSFTPTYNWGTNTAHKVRISTNNETLSVRIWPSGNAEPAAATYTVNMGTNTPAAGQAFIGVHNPSSGAGIGSINGVLIDDVTYSTSDAPPAVVFSASPATASASAPAAGIKRVIQPAALTASAAGVTPSVVLGNNTLRVTAVTASALAVMPSIARAYDTNFGEFTLGTTPSGFSAGTVTDLPAVQYAGGYALVGAFAYSNASPSTFDLAVRANIAPDGDGHGYLRITFAGNRTLDVEPSLILKTGGTIKATGSSTNVDPRNTNVWVRLRVTSGNHIQARAWYANTTEPSTWDVDFTDASTVNAGTVGVGSGFGTPRTAWFSLAWPTGTATTPTPPANVNFAAPVATASASAPTVIVSGKAKFVASASTASGSAPSAMVRLPRVVVSGVCTASATAVNPIVSAESHPDAIVDAPALTASALAVMPGLVAGTGAVVSVDVATADADSVDASFTNNTVRLILATPATAHAINPYYNKEDDPYYQIVKDLVDATDSNLWLRFEETSGSVAVNEAYLVGNPNTVATFPYVGTPEFGLPGPYGRKAVRFSSDDYIVINAFSGESNTPDFPGAWELSFKTTQQNTVIFGAQDVGVLYTTQVGVKIENGKIVIAGFGGAFTSRRSVADGQWHHVVIWYDGGGHTELFIDGVSDIKRPGAHFVGPDFIGRWGNTFFDNRLFVGDLDEIIAYDGVVAREIGETHYYAWRQAHVVATQSAMALAVAGNNKGRGNQKRALALYFRTNNGLPMNTAYYVQQTGEPHWSGIEWGETYPTHPFDAPFSWGGYIVFPVNMEETAAGPAFVNDYDLSPRYIDLQTDIDLSDYDLVFCIDIPARHRHIVWDGREIDTGPAWETFVEQLRAAQDEHGFSLWVPQPQLAADLGIVNYIETVGQYREGFGDRYAKSLDVFQRPLQNYYDNEYLHSHRIVNVVEGLTDLPGYVLRETVAYDDVDNPLRQFSEYLAYNIDERPGGLFVGDEIRYDPSALTMLPRDSNSDFYDRYYVRHDIQGVPANRGYVGTAVAMGRTEFYDGNGWKPSPAADLVTAIAVEHGTYLKGRPVGGRIFVNFMDSNPNVNTVLENANKDYIIPGTNGLASPFDFDSRRANTTIANLTWLDYSNEQTRPREAPYVLVNDVDPVYARAFLGMTYRGLQWLENVPEPTPEGAVRFHAPAVYGSANAPATNVVAKRKATVLATAARAQAESRYAETAVRLLAFAAEATARLVSPTRNVQPAVATATATMPEPEVTASGEALVFTLASNTLKFYVMEE